jgi:PTS system mannose-specific IIA component
MVGVVVITHGQLADELISAVEFVIGGKPCIKIMGVTMKPNMEFEQFSREIESAIRAVDSGGGILLITDMFGGTPSNVSLSFLEENRVEVISGANLPMLLKIATLSNNITLKEAVRIAESAGKDNIIVASELLRRNKRS